MDIEYNMSSCSTSDTEMLDAYPVEVSPADDEIKYLNPDEKVEMENTDRLAPITIMICDTIGALRSRHTLKILLDSGSTKSFIHRKCLPKDCKPAPVQTARTMRTITGNHIGKEIVTIRDIRLPELDKNRCIGQQKAFVFDNE
jgi:hypothetical protein